MNLIPWRNKEPEQGLSTPQRDWPAEIGSLIERVMQNPLGGGFFDFMSTKFGPRMDASEADHAIELRFELPGVKAEDVDIEVTGNVLTVRGEKRDERSENTRMQRYNERSFGSFSRSLQLPTTIDPEQVEAEFKDGVLKVTLTKRPGAQPKRISVRKQD